MGMGYFVYNHCDHSWHGHQLMKHNLINAELASEMSILYVEVNACSHGVTFHFIKVNCVFVHLFSSIRL